MWLHFALVRVFSTFSDASDGRSQVRHILQRAYHEREGRKEEGDRSERVDREEEGGRGGGGGKGGEGCREDYCRLRLRVERGRCARRGVHTIRCLDVARRRVDEAAKHGSRRAPSRRRCCPSVLFNTSHLSISHYPLFTFTKSAMARVVVIISAPGFHYCPLHVSVLSSTLSTLRFRTRTIQFSHFY